MNWSNLGNTIDNSFFFVVDKIIDLQIFFVNQAMTISKVVLFISLLSTFLNYALTGQGLKENLIKIMKAVLFFLIVISVYPRIIGFITNYAFSLAEGSIYPSIRDHFYVTTEKVINYVDYSPSGRTHINTTIDEIVSTTDRNLIFVSNSGISVPRKHTPTGMDYKIIAPASVFRVLYFLASQCFAPYACT